MVLAPLHIAAKHAGTQRTRTQLGGTSWGGSPWSRSPCFQEGPGLPHSQLIGQTKDPARCPGCGSEALTQPLQNGTLSGHQSPRARPSHCPMVDESTSPCGSEDLRGYEELLPDTSPHTWQALCRQDHN